MTQQYSRRGIVRTGSLGLVGATVLGTGGKAVAGPRGSGPPVTTRDDVRRQLHLAARRYEVPFAVLLAMGYVNTRLEMPPPAASHFRPGDPEGRGCYGTMALVRNDDEDTLGLAARLTGFSTSRLVTDQRANLLGGAALLAHSQGGHRPAASRRWLGAVAGPGGHGPALQATAGVGGGDLYADQVADALRTGFSLRTSRGEHLAHPGTGDAPEGTA